MILTRTLIKCKHVFKYSQKVPEPLRSKKTKSITPKVQNFVDLKTLRAIAGNGGNGCISFLHLWSNENAGPDGGDGGNGGHVIFKASTDIKDLLHVPTVIKAESGRNGMNRDCHGKNAEHCIIPVPVGTIIKNGVGKVIGDLSREGLQFMAARGGAGGKGNHFFISDTNQAPEICEWGAHGEELPYTLELRSMAHIGLIGLPNAGKSTLLQAVSRARPKVAPYPFTTLKPHIGMIQYNDYEQIAVADLPGLIQDSHKNRGLGIQFLKHAERCAILLYVIDLSLDEPWTHLKTLQHEISQFSDNLLTRPQLVVGNKIDLEAAQVNLTKFSEHTDLKIIPISAKMGTNITELLQHIRVSYDEIKPPPSYSFIHEFPQR